MIIALAFAHFSSELLLKEQMIIPVKKTLNNAGHIDAKLIDFSEICQKKSSEIGCFLLIVSWRSFPPKFPVKSADFSKNLPLKILQNLTFLHWNPRNRPICLRILTFFPRKSREIGQFFREFALENPAKFFFFFREISEALLLVNSFMQISVDIWGFVIKCCAMTQMKALLYIYWLLIINTLSV